MSFRINARTIFLLGAELISSDAVAIFELVKNAFDAKARRVTIEIVIRIPHDSVRELNERIHDACESNMAMSPTNWQELQKSVEDAIDLKSPYSRTLADEVKQSRSLEDLLNVLGESNYLVVSDTGEGMSLDTLNDVFLTIGTRSRLVARSKSQHEQGQAILGEKGVGRLAAMRLGTRLKVQSSMTGEPRWNQLDIDWSLFSHDSDELLEAIQLEPYYGKQKENAEESGTRILISNLTSEWTKERLQDIATKEFTKLTDPFTDVTVFPIQLLFNQEPVSILRFNRILLENAHATVQASFTRDAANEMRLYGMTRYKGREQTFSRAGAHLTSTSGQPMSVLERLGPFELEVYWYNRRILTALEGIGDRKTVRELVNDWGGGIMVFRDGFRVLPYGGPDDDWLDLDREAFRSGGYKVNRTQIIGRLTISGSRNPSLTDQTNREGLRDCEEKQALVDLLKYVVWNELRSFLNAIDDEIKASEPIYIYELEQRVEEEEQKILNNVDLMVERVPELRSEQSLINEIRDAVERLRTLMTDVRDLASSYEAGRGQLLNLAGVGISVETLAHELNRAIEHVLDNMANLSVRVTDEPTDSTLRVFESQLITLQRRISVIDSISTSRRQQRERFDVVSVVKDTVRDHQERFEREKIACDVQVMPRGRRSSLRVRAVKGMIIQVLGNLLDNSVYWLRQQRHIDPVHDLKIIVTVDTQARTLSVTDNGPGISKDLKDRVFEPFFSTKPPGRGKGLGLFISREIAQYHGANLVLEVPEGSELETFRTFTLTLGEMKQ